MANAIYPFICIQKKTKSTVNISGFIHAIMLKPRGDENPMLIEFAIVGRNVRQINAKSGMMRLLPFDYRGQPGGRECGASPGNRLGERVDDPSAAREPAGHSITTICQGEEIGRTECTFGMSGAVSASR